MGGKVRGFKGSEVQEVQGFKGSEVQRGSGVQRRKIAEMHPDTVL